MFKRPYLVIAKLIEQSTWGGSYILELKGWHTRYNASIIGQSYELFGESKLATSMIDSRDDRFIPEWGNADTPETKRELFTLNTQDFTTITNLIERDATAMLGAKTIAKYGKKMPLLVKLNQARGNSFQLHIKPETTSDRWIAKPETWYYFERGLATLGLAPGADAAQYRACCERIESHLRQLSAQIVLGALSLDDARASAKEFVAEQNPWQYVNVVTIEPADVVDPSAGGIHHSWEEDSTNNPLGNRLYEIQLDAMDPVATIRSFDQGKIKDDGTIRPMTIPDYFEHLDTNPSNNDVNKLKTHPTGENLVTNRFYDLKRIVVEGEKRVQTDGSFHHLYCHEGEVAIECPQGMVKLHGGHSAFVPAGADEYTLRSDGCATVLVGSVS